jgi:ATP-dependent Clp protease adaptor protein ClpS
VSSATQTDDATRTSTREKTSLARPWNVVVHDDPVTLMAYVTKIFMQVFGYPSEKARRLMLEVHRTGRSIVWTGGREQAEVFAQQLICTLERVEV